MPDSFKAVHDLFKAAKDPNIKLEYLFDALSIIDAKLVDAHLSCMRTREECKKENDGKYITRIQGIIGGLVIALLSLAIAADIITVKELVREAVRFPH